MEWLDWEDDSSFWADWDDEDNSRPKWRDFIVSMNLVDHPDRPKVVLYIIAEDFDNALTCGEVLSAVYFNA